MSSLSKQYLSNKTKFMETTAVVGTICTLLIPRKEWNIQVIHHIFTDEEKDDFVLGIFGFLSFDPIKKNLDIPGAISLMSTGCKKSYAFLPGMTSWALIPPRTFWEILMGPARQKVVIS